MPAPPMTMSRPPPMAPAPKAEVAPVNEAFDVAASEAFDAVAAGDVEGFKSALKAAVKACYAEEV